ADPPKSKTAAPFLGTAVRYAWRQSLWRPSGRRGADSARAQAGSGGARLVVAVRRGPHGTLGQLVGDPVDVTPHQPDVVEHVVVEAVQRPGGGPAAAPHPQAPQHDRGGPCRRGG